MFLQIKLNENTSGFFDYFDLHKINLINPQSSHLTTYYSVKHIGSARMKLGELINITFP